MIQNNYCILPTLFKKNSSGVLQQWDVGVVMESELVPPDGGSEPTYPTIVTVHGQIGGKMQTAREAIKEGKNVGRSNETTALQQACAEAQSKWELQKKKKGYVDNIRSAEAGEVDALVQGGIFPMLAQKFEKRAKDIEYPAFIQPKFDGHRCIGIVKGGVATLWSRTRKPITSMPHIEKALVELSRGEDAIFDGELYNHEYHNNFEQITKLIRPIKPVEGHEKVKLYIYDMPSVQLNFEERWRTLNLLFSATGRWTGKDDYREYGPLVNVETHQVTSEEDVTLAFDSFFSQGYEGAMLRTRDNMYVGHPTRRSPGLLKIKHFDDAEFEIVDVVEGSGKMAGKAIFVCVAGNGKTFRAVKNGPLSELQEYYQHRARLVGKIVTVQFMRLTNAEGVPRHGRALRFREDL